MQDFFFFVKEDKKTFFFSGKKDQKNLSFRVTNLILFFADDLFREMGQTSQNKN